MPLFKKEVKFILAIFFLIIVAYFGISLFIANKFTKTNPIPISNDKAEISPNGEDIEFVASDGIRLSGWFFPAASDKAVVLVHGIDDNRALVYYEGIQIAKFLLENNYNVLMFDLRGHGKSESTRLTYGLTEGNDVVGAVNFLESRGFLSNNIGIIAESFGAISTLMQIKNLDVGAIVVDSAASEMEPIIKSEMINREGLPEFLIPGVFFMAKAFFGVDISSIRPIDKIDSSHEVLIFHGDSDSLITVDNAERIFEKSSTNSRLVIFSDTTHIETFKNHPEQYRNEVLGYFEQKLR